ncbi:GNAT family N-acetyltransferase [Haloferacaceae archaeon DSL9]
MFPETIETDRLRLRRLTRELVDPLDAYEIYAHSESIEEETRYVTWSPHETPKETWDAFERFEKRWDDREAAVYGVFPREGEANAGEFVGTTGLHFEWETDAAGLGIWLRKPVWGRGYSGERAAALLDLAFDRLDLGLVSVSHLPENEQSKRAIEKYVDRFGGHHEGRFRHLLADQDGDVHDADRYSISQAEWREAVAAERPLVRYPELNSESE